MAKIIMIDTIIETELLKKKSKIQTILLCEPKSEMPPYQHGTICMKILEERTKDYEIINMVILDNEQKKVSIDRLVEALELCSTYKPDIISMSIGTTCLRDYQKLNGVIQTLDDMGIIMVAAPDNSSNRTWPAAMEQVIGVTCDWNEKLVPGELRVIEENPFGLNFVANANLEFKGEPVSFGQSNSYAVPIVVSFIHTCINKGMKEKDQIFTEIKNRFGTGVVYTQVTFPERKKNDIFAEPVVICQGINEQEFVEFIDFLWEEYGVQTVGITEDVQREDYTLIARKKMGSEIENFVRTSLRKDLVILENTRNQFRGQWDVRIQGKEDIVILDSAEGEIYVQRKDEGWMKKLVNRFIVMLTDDHEEKE